MDDATLFPRTDAGPKKNGKAQRESSSTLRPRLRRPDRLQMILDPVCLDDRLPVDHPARTIWSVVERLDLSGFYEPLKARGPEPGRAATDPKLLIGLWLYGATQGVGSGRGLGKVRCIALWSALAYNLMHFAPVLFT